MELQADSSADLLVSLDGVDDNLSPQNGACGLATERVLGRDELYSGRIRIPASVLNVPGCGGSCADAYAGPANGASTGCGAGAASGQICDVACNTGFALVGGNVR